MHQLAKKSLPEKVMESLESEIVTGKYAIGDKIPPEPELIQHFKVSRNTIREAVQSLIHAGILEARQGSGTYVVATNRLQVEIEKRWKQCDFVEIEEFRTFLGKILIKSASEKRSAYDVKNLEEKANQLKDSLKNIIKASNLHHDHSDFACDLGDSSSEFPPTKNKKNKKKNTPSSFFSGEASSLENSNNLLADISLLKSLDDEYNIALMQGAESKLMQSLFVCLQKEYIAHIAKDNKEIWINNIKIYGQLAMAIKNKDSKSLKKYIKKLYG